MQTPERETAPAFLRFCGGVLNKLSVVPAFALGHAHISEAPSCGGGVEVFEAVPHGDGTWRFGRWITVPAAETADDPGRPGEAVGRVRGFQPFTLGLEVLVEGSEGCHPVDVEGKPDGLMVTAMARLQELDGDDRRLADA